MVDPQSSRFWQAALQSRLIDAADLTACWEALTPEKRVADQLDRRLARQAVQAGMLTLWQAQQLLAGRCTGFKIDRYILQEMIGQGGMGRVYLAKDSRLNRRVALKILSPERVNNPRAIARFQREARVGAQLEHENLVRVYDEGESDGKCYLVMEFIAGKTIGAMIAEHGPLPASTAAKLTQQVALGLEHAQQKGLIHRDVNPYNIMVTSDGTAKLADLGLAIDLAEQVPVTRDGATVGTFDYISPEQARHSHSVDTRSDIYSLGCSLYHMLTGQVPYPSPSLPEKLFGHQAVEPEPVTALAPDVPEGLVEVVRHMMRKRPEDRYQNPLEVARALDAFVDESGSSFRTSPFGMLEGPPKPSSTTHSSTQVAIPAAQRNRKSGSGSGSGSGSKSGSGGVKDRGTPRAANPAASNVNAPAPDAIAESKLLEGLVEFGPKPIPAPAPAPAPPPTPPPALPPPPAVPSLDFSRIGQDQPADAKRKKDLAGLGLALDFGPEPTLSEVAARSKARPPATEPQSTIDPANSVNTNGESPQVQDLPPKKQGSNRRLILGLTAAVLLIAVTGGLFATGVLRRPNPGPTPRPPLPSPKRSVQGAEDPPAVVEGKTNPKTSPPASASASASSDAKVAPPKAAKGLGITVKRADGTVTTEPDLKTAMQRAIGSRGHVLLSNREPIRLAGEDAAIKVSGGPLYIRAAEGTQPILEVEIKGSKPFLTTGVDAPLTIAGVTIVVHGTESGREAPPVIEGGSRVTLDRCAFKLTGKPKRATAVRVLGIGLTATGVSFDGFDQTIDVAAYNGSVVTLKHCIVTHVRAGDAPRGWALRVRNKPGGRQMLSRRLVLERCTVLGQGLLDLAGFSPEIPYQVEISGCAVIADALLAWQTQPPDLPLSSQALHWLGHDNQYDIRGQAWVVRSPAGTPALPDGPTDIDSWTKRVDESTPLAPPVKLQTEPANLSESPSPRDFLVLGAERPVGAEPDRVGPRSKASKP